MNDITDWAFFAASYSKTALNSKAFILCRSGLKRGVYVLPSYEPQSRYHNLKFQLDTKCASGKPLVVHCTSDPDELETCNLLQNPPKTSINSLQLKLRRPTNNQKELKVSLGHDSAGEGATINNVYRPFHCNIYMNWPVIKISVNLFHLIAFLIGYQN